MSFSFDTGVQTPAGVEGFMFWCQKVLPLAYDNSLSYYETLCKISDKLNETIKQGNQTAENIVKLNEAYVALQKYVNEYFESLDVKNMIDNAVQQSFESGEMYDYVISRITASDIGAAPEGYGLGTFVTNARYFEFSQDLLKRGTGFYAYEVGVPSWLDNPTPNAYWNVLDVKYGTKFHRYLGMKVNTGDVAFNRYTDDMGGNLPEWEYLNPPLQGSRQQVYKTMFKFNGYPVYRVRLYMGQMPTAGSVVRAAWELPTGQSVSNVRPIGWCGCAGNISLSYLTDLQVGIFRNEVLIRASQDYSSRTGEIVVDYIVV